MQVLWYAKSKWAAHWMIGSKVPPGVWYPGFYCIRFWRIEVRLGWGRFGKKWGRPRSQWSYEHG